MYETEVPCDYVGAESASKVPDKFAKAGFTATKSEFVNVNADESIFIDGALANNKILHK